MPLTNPEKRAVFNKALALYQASGGRARPADIMDRLQAELQPVGRASVSHLRQSVRDAVAAYELAQRMNASGPLRPRATSYPELSYQDARLPQFQYRVAIWRNTPDATGADRALIAIDSADRLTADEVYALARRHVTALQAGDAYQRISSRISDPATTSISLVSAFRRVAQ